MKSRIERALSNILSRKHDAKIQVKFIELKEKDNGNNDKSGDISKE